MGLSALEVDPTEEEKREESQLQRELQEKNFTDARNRNLGEMMDEFGDMCPPNFWFVVEKKSFSGSIMFYSYSSYFSLLLFYVSYFLYLLVGFFVGGGSTIGLVTGADSCPSLMDLKGRHHEENHKKGIQ